MIGHNYIFMIPLNFKVLQNDALGDKIVHPQITPRSFLSSLRTPYAFLTQYVHLNLVCSIHTTICLI
jgi:hypothetical protein